MGYGFSFYTLTERFANILGPLSWGMIIRLGHAQIISYRIAMTCMALFVVIGLAIIVIKKPKEVFVKKVVIGL